MSDGNLICIFNAYTSGLSGGDRIAIELLKRWVTCFDTITVLTSETACDLFRRYTANHNLNFIILSTKREENANLVTLYFTRLIKATYFLLRFRPKSGTIVYSSSDFWPDSIPALIAKIRSPHSIWIAGFYLFAPSPLNSNSPYNSSPKRRLIGVAYWFSQLPIYCIIKRYADYVFVTSEPDVARFITDKRDISKIIVIQGGVDVTESKRYHGSGDIKPVSQRKYDACYIGRFHYQKGVLELVDIWNFVVKKKSKAKLAMIGVGPLEGDVKKQIEENELGKNIDVLGFMDGEKKYQVFKESKVIVHPAIYDSGGMAAAEGMAWGLPGVSFDLEALKTYYPKGMIKTECFNLSKFSDNILSLLEDEDIYMNTSRDARELVDEIWDWDKRAVNILNRILKSEPYDE